MAAHLGKVIRRVRNDRGLRQSDVAEVAGVDNSTVSSIERGLVNPSLVTFLLLAEALGIRGVDLLAMAEEDVIYPLLHERLEHAAHRSHEHVDRPVRAGMGQVAEHGEPSADGVRPRAEPLVRQRLPGRKDQRRLAVMAYSRSSELSMASLDPSGSGRVDPATAVRSPSLGWCAPSPAGDWLACTSRGAQEDIVLMRPDGSDTVRLIELATNAGYTSTKVNGAIEIDAPSVWAPDLNRLAWQAGITLKELQATSADLEQAFFAMTGSDKTGNE